MQPGRTNPRSARTSGAGEFWSPGLRWEPSLREVLRMIRSTKPASKTKSVKRRNARPQKPPKEAIAGVLLSPPAPTPFGASPIPPISAPERYLGNIAELAGALHPARVRFPGNAAGAIGWIARRLGHRLPDTAEEIARTVLDPLGEWRCVDDRPWLAAQEYAESAQRLADRGLLVIAVRTVWKNSPDGVALVAPGGMLPPALPASVKKVPDGRTLRQIRTPRPRIEDFTGRAPSAGAPYLEEEWVYRQAPAWRLRSAT